MKLGSYIIDFDYFHLQNHVTRCIISNSEGLYLIADAVCHEKDRFVKSVGRKIALKRALGELNISKEERALIWKEYFAKVRR